MKINSSWLDDIVPARIKHYVITEVDGRQISEGKFKKFRISKYNWMRLRTQGITERVCRH